MVMDGWVNDEWMGLMEMQWDECEDESDSNSDPSELEWQRGRVGDMIETTSRSTRRDDAVRC